MGTRPRFQTSNDQLPAEVAELLLAVGTLPDEYRQRLEPTVSKVVESARRRRKILELVQEALSQLRLDMKYLIFDLQATRRERDEYKRMVEGA